MPLRTRHLQRRLFPFVATDVQPGTAPAGKLYVFANTEMPGLLKIGSTRKSVGKRRRELQRQTANPGRFITQLWYSAHSVRIHEDEVHTLLVDYWVETGKEFFRVSPEVAYQKMRAYFGREPDWMANDLRRRLEAQGLLGKAADPP